VKEEAMPLVGSGIIGPGGAEHFDVVLRAGGLYQVYVQPFEPGIDFDLYVYDENGNLISQDIDIATDAYCAISPHSTGAFRFVVNSLRGTSGYRIEVQE
jgi:hypothetical protein